MQIPAGAWGVWLWMKLIPALLGVSTCRATSFECLRHIHLSLRQSMTYPCITSNHILYHILNIALTDTFQYIHSEGILGKGGWREIRVPGKNPSL